MTASARGEVLARALPHLDEQSWEGSPVAHVFGRSASPCVAPLTQRGFDVTVSARIDSAPATGPLLDLVMVADGLEHEEWDRWLLQMIHRRLKPGGILILTVPNLLALGSPGDLAFLMRRALREASRQIRKWAGRSPAREPFSERRYRPSALVRMLDSLGFNVVRIESLESGWIPSGWIPERFRQLHLVVCRREASLFGFDAERPFPDPTAFVRNFEAARRELVDDRERWLARNPTRRREVSVPLNLDSCRGAHVLVLAPHPDDDVIPCAGTLAQLIARGARVTVVHATDGSEAASLWHVADESRRTVRLREAEEVARVMGFETLEFWREDNSAFRFREELAVRLAAILEARTPKWILVPFVTDIHPDHVVLARILARALELRPLPDTEVLGYQTWCLVPIGTHCVVTREMPLVERVISLYETAMKVEDYVHFAQDHDYYAACTRELGPEYAEAFYSVPAGAFAQLLATVEERHG
jgi:LmbE family N-acetylglucosaminyl deacetylase/SAM-dependent methyltransferase